MADDAVTRWMPGWQRVLVMMAFAVIGSARAVANSMVLNSVMFVSLPDNLLKAGIRDYFTKPALVNRLVYIR